MAKTTKELLSELSTEAGDARRDMGQGKSGLVRPGEVSDDSEDFDDELEEDTDEDDEDSEQDEDSDDEDEDLDEDDEESDDEDESDEDDEEEDDDEDSEDDEDDEDLEDDDEDESTSRNNEAAQRRILAKKDKKISELSALVDSLKEAGDKAQQEDLIKEITPLASELKLDPNSLAKIIEAASKVAERRLAGKLPSQESLDVIARQREDGEEKAYFDTEWKGFEKTLVRQYPSISARQVQEAKKLMDEISHDPRRGGKKYVGKDGKERLMPHDLAYIHFQNKRDFDRILSNRKRHGLESGRSRSTLDETGEAPNLKTSKGVDAMDKLYRDAEANDSGLRRGRRPRSRTI